MCELAWIQVAGVASYRSVAMRVMCVSAPQKVASLREEVIVVRSGGGDSGEGCEEQQQQNSRPGTRLYLTQEIDQLKEKVWTK